jgi:hypothetical protein
VIFRWLKRHLPLAVTSAGVVAITSLVAVLAAVSGGYTEQKLSLDDASVWVANGSRQVVGRANTSVLELNTVVKGTGSDLDVLQQGDLVLTHDRTSNTLDLVDAATSAVTATIALPPNDPEVSLVKDYLVIHSPTTGEVWLVREANLETFDAGTVPDLTLDAGSVLAVDDDGDLAGYDRVTKQLITEDVDSSAGPTSHELPDFAAAKTDDLSITLVGGKAVLLNATTGQASVDGRIVLVSDRIGAAEKVTLSQPDTTGDRALLAFTGGLLAIDVASGQVTDLMRGRTGNPARATTVSGCSYAAWSDGSAWKQCAGDKGNGELTQLSGLGAGQGLVFRSNGRYVVLNDSADGKVWAVQDRGQLIDNWDKLIDDDAEDTQQVESNEATPPELEKDELPPDAVDDELGARPGRANVLPVLLNDSDPNGDVLVIGEVGEFTGPGRLDLVANDQQLQLTLDDDAIGTYQFDYTVTDGRGASDTATVTVTVRAPGENSAPVQARPTNTSVAVGGQFTANVLGDWYDPDADPMYLESASVADPDRVSFSPAGEITYQDKGTDAGSKEIGLSVSDFTASGTGRVGLTIGAPGEVPIVADGFTVRGYTGQEVTIEPLAHVRGGTGLVRLANVAESPNTTIEPNYNLGSFGFTAQSAGTVILSYSLVDATGQTGTGTIRVDVRVAPDASTKPITVPTVAYLYQQQTDVVDVLAGDIDPAGGVLTISGVEAVPKSTGAVIEILDHRILRVRLNNVLSEPLQFSYTVTNGYSSAQGSVTVFQIPEPKRLQAPVANTDTISVRVGEVVDIPVLDNDVHPNRKPLVLAPDLVQDVPSGGGLLFVSGDHLRYLAPPEPGNYTAIYKLETPSDVQFDTAEVKITVREADLSTNTPPAPKTVSARVVAGESVKVTIPLTGIDADGDSVRLVGAASNPEKGNVTVGDDSLSYTASSVAQGTDSFGYEVVDSLGARATGTIRIGVIPRVDTASTPVAMDDVVVAEPGKTLTVRVLDNDSDPNASALSVVSAEPTDARVTATVEDDTVVFKAPEQEGDYGVIYTIQNAQGQQSSAWLRVSVSAEAPPIRPEADDTVLTLSDILGKDSVDVDVLAHVFYAEGDVRGLKLSLVPGYGDTAQVTATGRVRVQITEKSQIIPFQVARADDRSATAHAFIWVPGRADAVPELKTDAPKLSVTSGDTLTIDIDDFVVAAGGKQAQLTDTAKVKASNSNGADLASGPTTLVFTSADGYWGPASLSFEVTDGTSASDPNGRKAVIVLPITVNPRDNQPPVFSGADITLEPGTDRVVDLQQLTKYPYPADLQQLVYSINTAPAAGFSASLTGTQLTVHANEDAPVGTSSQVAVGVRDDKNAGQAGSVKLSVVTSNRPLASPTPDSLTIRRGDSEQLPVLANDQGANPFPGKPLTVVAVRGALPAGVHVTPSDDKSTLSVAVDESTDLHAAGQVSLQYQVADATKDPARYTWGTVSITIVDVPDTPVAPVLSGSGFVNGQLTVSAEPLPYPNGAPITSFLIRDESGGYQRDCGPSATCVLTDLVQGQDYRFYSVAVNSYGQSDQSPLSAPMRSDSVPAAPTGLTIGATAANNAQSNPGQLTLHWDPIPDPVPGSAIENVYVKINGHVVTLPPKTTSMVYPGDPGTQYVAEVWAQNGADTLYPGQISWNTATSAQITAVGAPTSPGAPQAAVSGSDGTVTVTWHPFGANGGGPLSYRVQRFDESQEPVMTCDIDSGPGTSQDPGYSDSATTDGESYRYVVYAYNGWGCTAAQSNSVRVLEAPSAPDASVGYRELGGGFYGAKVTALSTPGAHPGVDYSYTVDDGTPVEVGDSLSLGGSDFGSPLSWTFRSCASDGVTTPPCSDPSAPVSLTPINANIAIPACTSGAAATASDSWMLNPGGADWSFEYAYKIGSADWSEWGTDSTVPTPTDPADTVTMAVRTSGTNSMNIDEPFHNGEQAADLADGNVRQCN